MIQVFFSWQSDLPKDEHHHFITKSLKNLASKQKGKKNSFEIIESADRQSGTVDIIDQILSNISHSDIFICDITCSFQQQGSVGKKSPNPNVLFELGYAVSKLGCERVICVFNSNYCTYQDLPFDIRNRRIISFNHKEPNSFENSLWGALSGIIKIHGSIVNIETISNRCDIYICPYQGDNIISSYSEEFSSSELSKHRNEMGLVPTFQTEVMKEILAYHDKEYDDHYSGELGELNPNIHKEILDAMKHYRAYHSCRYFDIFTLNKGKSVVSEMIHVTLGNLPSSFKILPLEYLKQFEFIDLLNILEVCKSKTNYLFSKKIINLFPEEKNYVGRIYYSCSKECEIKMEIHVMLNNGFEKKFSNNHQISVTVKEFDPIDFYNWLH